MPSKETGTNNRWQKKLDNSTHIVECYLDHDPVEPNLVDFNVVNLLEEDNIVTVDNALT